MCVQCLLCAYDCVPTVHYVPMCVQCQCAYVCSVPMCLCVFSANAYVPICVFSASVHMCVFSTYRMPMCLCVFGANAYVPMQCQCAYACSVPILCADVLMC